MKKNKVSISNPEELEKKLQYSSPVTWIALGVVFSLIVGLFVWSCVFRIKDKIIGKAKIVSSEVTLVVDANSISKLKVGQKVYINNLEGEILKIVEKKPIISHFALADGEYEYTIINEIKPIEYLIK